MDPITISAQPQQSVAPHASLQLVARLPVLAAITFAPSLSMMASLPPIPTIRYVHGVLEALGEAVGPRFYLGRVQIQIRGQVSLLIIVIICSKLIFIRTFAPFNYSEQVLFQMARLGRVRKPIPLGFWDLHRPFHCSGRMPSLHHFTPWVPIEERFPSILSPSKY
jgi:hypothetical protein